MPSSIKLQEEFGDDLQVIFVESQGTTVQKTHEFILDHKWMASDAMWTDERPFDLGIDGLPSYGLIGADGTLLSKGNYMNSTVEELIEKDIRNAGEAPEDSPKEIAKAWKYFSKDKLEKAFEELDDAAEEPELAEDAAATRAVLEGRVQARVDAAQWRIDNGYYAKAEELLEKLEDAVEDTDFEADVTALVERLESDDLEEEIEAEEKLQRITDRLYEDGFDDKGRHQRALEKFLEDYAGSKAATRARWLMSLVPSGH